jgi:diketogulonate reductase-like aldo/keto reductase
LSDSAASGLVRTIGVSNFSLEQLQQAVRICPLAISAVQIHYNLLERSAATEPFLRFCRKEGIAVVAYRPLERRLLTDPTGQPLLAELAEKCAKTPAQIAIAWLIGQEGVVPIPKASRPGHIDENLGALDVVLEAEDRLMLDNMPGNRGSQRDS